MKKTILATAVLLATVPVHAESLNEKLGYCAGVFATDGNTYALENKEGGVKVMSLHYARAFASYMIANKSIIHSKADVKKVEQSATVYAMVANKYLHKHPNQLDAESAKCAEIVPPIYLEFVEAGTKLDSLYRGTLDEFVLALAKNARTALGFN